MGQGNPGPSTLKVRVGSLVFNINCAVSFKVLHPLILCGMKPQTSPTGQGRQGRQLGNLLGDSIKNTLLLTKERRENWIKNLPE